VIRETKQSVIDSNGLTGKAESKEIRNVKRISMNNQLVTRRSVIEMKVHV
jgi:hypothetical protein